MSAQQKKPSAKTLRNRKKRQRRKLKKNGPVKKIVQKKPANKQQPKIKHIEVLRKGVKTDDRDFRRTTSKTKNASVSIYMQNTQNEIAFDVTVPSTVFYAVPAGLVSLCLQRGWMAGAENSSIPYLAFGYMCYIVQSFALNTILPTVKIPKLLALYCHSLMTKSVRASGGKVNYRLAFTADTIFPSQLVLGPTSNAVWSLYVPSNTGITNVWPNFTAPTAYTPELGQSAYQSFIQFLENSIYNFEGSLLSLVACADDNKMDKDVSAFAVTYADPGGAYNYTGGFGKQIYMEVPIHSPLFSVNYYNPLNQLDVNRYASFTNSFAGSGFLIAALATTIKERWTGMKTPPTFKCIDLNEFIEVYALVLQKAIYLALQDPQTATLLLAMNPVNVLAYLVSTYQCPLTLLEFSVLLRNEMINLFKDTQFSVQDIFPRSSASAVSLFTACVVGSNTCALGGATSMLIPRILAENMRACTYAMVESGKNDRNPILAFPVLGIYSGVVLDPADYAVTITVGTSTYNFTVFTVNGSEVPLSLIDGTGSGPNVVVGINDPAANNMLTTMYNDWFNGTSQISSFVSNPTTISTDAGVTLLTNMNLTLYWTPSQVDQVSPAEKRAYWKAVDAWCVKDDKGKKGKEPVPSWEPTPHEYRFGRKDRKFSHLDTSPFCTSIVQNISFRFPLVQSIWEGGQQFFIKPVINAITDSTVNASNQISRIAAQQREFNNLIISLGGTSTSLTLAYYHDNLASLMVAARNAPSKGTEFEAQLAEISQMGGGSIFNDVVSAFSQVAEPIARIGVPLAMMAMKSQGPRKNIIMGKNMIMG